MTTPRGVVRDAGETLIELLIAMVVIGLGVTAILGALVVAVDSSSMNRSQARAQATLRSWAESLAATTDDTTSSYHYVNCATTSSFPAPSSLPTGYTATVQSVQYWSGTAWSSTCGTDQGIQRVHVTVTAPASLWPGITQEMNVVVRRPCVSASAC